MQVTCLHIVWSFPPSLALPNMQFTELQKHGAWLRIKHCPHFSFSKYMPGAAQAEFDVTFVFLHLLVTGPAALTCLVYPWLPTFTLQKEISGQRTSLYLPTGDHGHQIPACLVNTRLVCYKCSTLLWNPDRIPVGFTEQANFSRSSLSLGQAEINK